MERDIWSAHEEMRWEREDEVRFEKIGRRDRAPLPVSSETRTARSAKETYASRRARKAISRSAGGMHRRRRKKIR
jgi:hypothetical protein